MSTLVREVPEGWVVSTVLRAGTQRKIARVPVLVRDKGVDALKAEVRLQARAARMFFRIEQTPEEPVV